MRRLLFVFASLPLVSAVVLYAWRGTLPADRSPEAARASSASPVLRGTVATAEPRTFEGDEVAFMQRLREGIPEDPVGVGSAVLSLTLLDTATGNPVASHVQLWRMDAPGNQHWKRGDQEQGFEYVETNKPAVFRSIPVGRYRIHAEGQATGTGDPPAFAIGPGTNVHTVSIPMPRVHRVLLEVTTRSGIALTTGLVRDAGGTEYTTSSTPDWIRARTHRGKKMVRTMASDSHGHWDGNETARPIIANGNQLELGEISAPSRSEFVTFSSLQVDFPKYASVDVSLKTDQDSHAYRATTVPLAALHDIVVLPDGRRAIDAGAAFEASVMAHRVGDGEAGSSVVITVRCRGYETLRATLDIAEPLPTRIMRQK